MPEKFDCAGSANSPAAHLRQPRLRMMQPEVVAQRQILDVRAGPARELADAVHRVVIVRRQHARHATTERVRLRHELDRGARVRREADNVVVSSVEEAEHVTARRVDRRRACPGRRVVRMRIAEHAAREQGVVRVDVRVRVERAAGVIQVRHAIRVEPRELALSQLGEERLGRGDGMGQHPFPGRAGGGPGLESAIGFFGSGVLTTAAAAPSASATIASQNRAFRVVAGTISASIRSAAANPASATTTMPKTTTP